MTDLLNFKVSTGLKSIIGQDLITSNVVAIFELVKNSFDAHASHVHIVFEEDTIWIIDDGKGMTYDDLVMKWLFVAYSAKRDGTEDKDYRDKLSNARYAGNKGVGRFSCDRLGRKLKLQTSSRTENNKIHELSLDWDQFDKDHTEEFIEIDVSYKEKKQFIFPENVIPFDSGTILEISNLRSEWERVDLQKLRAHLEKLINPFELQEEKFKITLLATKEKIKDTVLENEIKSLEKNLLSLDGKDKEQLQEQIAKNIRQIVNGPIRNFIFSELADKTTRIEIDFTENGKNIVTTLIDRGKLIYKIEEKNLYQYLGHTNFSCRLFYLNQQAKSLFTRRIGVRPIQFGSVFLFRNNFRVYPIGEEGVDTFGIDHRKQQGYARFLGSRDLIGRIDVHGSEEYFKEATSRDHGLIKTDAYLELEDCFLEKCLKRLEAYVVDVTWQDALDKFRDEATGLMSAPARARIIELLASITKSSNINVLEYAEDIVDVLSERVNEFESSIGDLRIIAKKLNDKSLEQRIIRAEKNYQELKNAEVRAKVQAEIEQAARIKAQLEAKLARQQQEEAEQAQRQAEKDKEQAEKDKEEAVKENERTSAILEEEKKRNLFLAAITSMDVETVINLQHQIKIYSANVHELIESQIERLRNGEKINTDSWLTFLEHMRFNNELIMVTSRLATKANFRMESDIIKDDLVSYIAQYATTVTIAYFNIQVLIKNADNDFVRSFKPIEIASVVDNLLANARKAGAHKVEISFRYPDKKTIEVLFQDNGRGLSKLVDENRIFEKGVSTTDGSGLGLYYCRQIVEAMNGTIEYLKPTSHNGSTVKLTFPMI